MEFASYAYGWICTRAPGNEMKFPYFVRVADRITRSTATIITSPTGKDTSQLLLKPATM